MSKYFAALLGHVTDEVKGILPWLAERLIRWIIQLLPIEVRQRYGDEFLSELDCIPRKFFKLLYALRILFGLYEIRKELNRYKKTILQLPLSEYALNSAMSNYIKFKKFGLQYGLFSFFLLAKSIPYYFVRDCLFLYKRTRSLLQIYLMRKSLQRSLSELKDDHSSNNDERKFKLQSQQKRLDTVYEDLFDLSDV